MKWKDNRVTVYKNVWLTGAFYLCGIAALLGYMSIFVFHL